VLGVDPAAMPDRLTEHPGFRHLRRRANQAPRREFRKTRWLTADMNVAPGCTLDVVEDIVTHPQVNVRGMLLTLKLPQWELAADVPKHIERVKSWGFNQARARHLTFGHQEVCLAALKHPFRRSGKVKKRSA
jgi:23S rRNA (cytidine2498-2'-O)-methyltransferase